MTDLNTLADRIESLTGPSREVDLEIHNSPFPPSLHYRLSANTPAFTASLDAAMALVPEGLGREAFFLQRNSHGQCFADVWTDAEFNRYVKGKAATPALALCAAALRARSKQP